MQLSAPPIHHIGYVVEDLAAGIERFATQFGAGPFLVMEHLEFDEVTVPRRTRRLRPLVGLRPVGLDPGRAHPGPRRRAGRAAAGALAPRHRPRRLAGRRPRGRDRAAGGRRAGAVPHGAHRSRVGRLVRRRHAVRPQRRGAPAPRRDPRLLRAGALGMTAVLVTRPSWPWAGSRRCLTSRTSDRPSPSTGGPPTSSAARRRRRPIRAAAVRDRDLARGGDRLRRPADSPTHWSLVAIAGLNSVPK